MWRILLNFIKACMSLENNIMQMADCVFVFAVFAFIDRRHDKNISGACIW